MWKCIWKEKYGSYITKITQPTFNLNFVIRTRNVLIEKCGYGIQLIDHFYRCQVSRILLKWLKRPKEDLIACCTPPLRVRPWKVFSILLQSWSTCVRLFSWFVLFSHLALLFISPAVITHLVSCYSTAINSVQFWMPSGSGAQYRSHPMWQLCDEGWVIYLFHR